MDKDQEKFSDAKAPVSEKEKAFGILGAARDLFPALAGMFGGKVGEKAVEALIRAAERIFGTSDPAAIRDTAKESEAKREDFRDAIFQAGLVHVREQVETEVRQEYRISTQADVARNANLVAAQANPHLAWVPTIISMFVLVGFYGALFALIFAGGSAASEGNGRLNTETLVYVMLGALTTSMTAVITYWLGSSAESSRQVQIMQRTLSDQLREQGRG